MCNVKSPRAEGKYQGKRDRMSTLLVKGIKGKTDKVS